MSSVYLSIYSHYDDTGYGIQCTCTYNTRPGFAEKIRNRYKILHRVEFCNLKETRSALPGGFQPQDWLGKIGFNLELQVMSVNDIPRNSFNDMEKEGPPPEYSPSCSNNGGHQNDASRDGVVTADIVQEHS